MTLRYIIMAWCKVRTWPTVLLLVNGKFIHISYRHILTQEVIGSDGSVSGGA